MAIDQSESIAMTYTTALFELAEEQQVVSAIREELDGIARIIRTLPDFKVFLECPALSRDDKLSFISRIFTGQLSPLLMDFLKVLAGNDRLELLDEVQVCFAELEDQRAGRVNGILTTVFELSGQERVRLNEQINRVLHKTVTLQNKVDPDIIGGMILKVGDLVTDISVKGSLVQMKKRLQKQSAEKIARNAESFFA